MEMTTNNHNQRNGQTKRRLFVLILLVLWIELSFFSHTWFTPDSKGGGRDNRVNDSPREFDGNNNDSSSNICTVYMAPSSVHGITSMGIYTARNLSKNEVIVKAIDGLSIPVVDYYKSIKNESESTQQARHAWISEFDEYWWGRGVADQLKLEAETAVDFKITFSELPNHHCILASLTIMHPSRLAYNDGILKDRRSDPGVGAFSYHMGRKISVNRDVKAGEELFLNYGHCGQWNRHMPDWAMNTTGYKDFNIAARAAASTWNELLGFESLENMKEPQRKKQGGIFDDIVYNISQEVAILSPGAASIFPTTYEGLKNIMTNLPMPTGRGIAMSLAREIGTTPRTVEWIRKHGMCVDTIAPRPSQVLAHAGQGAIARYFVPKGEIIVPAPMLHIMDKEVLRLNVDSGNPNARPYQLLMNYCFGHNQSSLLLCPITNAMLVNHCSFRKKDECGGMGPNAEYRWASGWDNNKTRTFMQMSLEELGREKARGLSIEVFATRDIQEGEEIFMDYGRGWETAWDEHVKNWSPPTADHVFDSYVSPTKLNDDGGPLKLLVNHDLRKIVTHPNLFTGCLFWTTEFDYDEERWWLQEEVYQNGTMSTVGPSSWEELSDKDILKRYATHTGEEFAGDYEDQYDGAYWPCVVFDDKQGNGTSYTVRILQSTFRPDTEWYNQDLPRFITNFPRGSIRYFNKPYTSDQHLFHAFRHPVEFRDDLFPEQWKNLK